MRRWFIRAGVLLVGVGLIVVVVVLARTAPPRSVTLANGVTLDCLGATYGTNHVTPGPSRLGRLLPRPLRSMLGFDRPTQFFPSDTPLLAVWLEDDPAASSNRVGRVGLVALLADEQGVVAGSETWHSLFPTTRGRGGTFNLQFRAVPRRSRELVLRFYDEGSGGERALLGELPLPNPAFSDAPKWEAGPLPIVRTNGALACQLHKVVAGVGHHTRSVTTATGTVFTMTAAQPGQRPQAVGLFRFTENDLPGTNWVVGSVLLADATGNALSCGSSSHRTNDDLVAHRFGAILWPSEVWDMTVWAMRKSTAVFSEEEAILLENIAIPPSGGTNQLDQEFRSQGIEVRVEHFSHQPPPPRGGYSMDDLTHLRVELSELPEGMYFELAEIRDDQGRELQSGGWSRSHGKPSVCTFSLTEVPEGAKTVTARFVLQQGRRFEFRVQPELVGTNGFQMTVDD